MTERQCGAVMKMVMVNSFAILGLGTLVVTVTSGWGALGVLATCACFATAKLLAD